METDQLIRTLAADTRQRAWPVGLVLALALLAAGWFRQRCFSPRWASARTS